MINNEETHLHKIGGVYYMGRTPCQQIVEEAISKPIRHGNGWARRGTHVVASVEYMRQLNGPKKQ